MSALWRGRDNRTASTERVCFFLKTAGFLGVLEVWNFNRGFYYSVEISFMRFYSRKWIKMEKQAVDCLCLYHIWFCVETDCRKFQHPLTLYNFIFDCVSKLCTCCTWNVCLTVVTLSHIWDLKPHWKISSELGVTCLMLL